MDRPAPHVLKIDPGAAAPPDLAPAAAWLARGGIVAFPTDTFYGLAVDPTSPAAVQALFDLKGRDASVAVPLVAASLAQVDAFCGPLTGATRRLALTFWPGPLSLVCAAPATCRARRARRAGHGRHPRAGARHRAGARGGVRGADHGDEREPERRAAGADGRRSRGDRPRLEAADPRRR